MLQMQQVGHIAARCPFRTLVIQEDDDKVEDIEELVYDPNVEETQDVKAEWEDDPSYLACIRAISPQVDDFKNFGDRKSTRLNSSHYSRSRMPSSA